MSRLLLLLMSSLIIAGWLTASLFIPQQSSLPPPVAADAENHPGRLHSPVVIYCAASNRDVMETIATDYHKTFPERSVEFQFGPSQALLASIEISGTGDLYLPADASYLDTAEQRGVVGERFPVARMNVVLGVAPGNPKGILQFHDLLRDDIRLVQANPEVAAVGKLTRELLTTHGTWDLLLQNTDAFVASVTEAANSVQAGAADVAILYDSMQITYPELMLVPLPEFRNLTADVQIGVINSSTAQKSTRHFIDYLLADDGGRKRYQEFGFHLPDKTRHNASSQDGSTLMQP